LTKFMYILLILMLITSGCGKFSNMPLPKATAHVENSNISIPVGVTSSSWGLTGESYGGPWDAMENKEPIQVPGNSKITLTFDHPPKEVKANENLSKDTFKKVNYESNQIAVPADKGIHIYSFIANWPKGTAVYALKVEVK